MANGLGAVFILLYKLEKLVDPSMSLRRKFLHSTETSPKSKIFQYRLGQGLRLNLLLL